MKKFIFILVLIFCFNSPANAVAALNDWIKLGTDKAIYNQCDDVTITFKYHGWDERDRVRLYVKVKDYKYNAIDGWYPDTKWDVPLIKPTEENSGFPAEQVEYNLEYKYFPPYDTQVTWKVTVEIAATPYNPVISKTITFGRIQDFGLALLHGGDCKRP